MNLTIVYSIILKACTLTKTKSAITLETKIIWVLFYFKYLSVEHLHYNQSLHYRDTYILVSLIKPITPEIIFAMNLCLIRT